MGAPAGDLEEDVLRASVHVAGEAADHAALGGAELPGVPLGLEVGEALRER